MLLIAGLALPIGAAGAALAWALLRLIGLITNLVFYGRVDTALVAPGGQHHHVALLLLAPVAGGLVVGLMARYGSEKIRGHGMPEAIEAVLVGGSRVQPRVAVLKPISAAVAIGTGGPFGAEGPIIMTGGAAGSLFAQFLRLTADERKTLLVAGAAAGMAATFNAPLASVLLAVELLLFEWRPRSFVPVAAAVGMATALRVPLLGADRIFAAPAIPLHLDALVYLGCIGAGVAAALLALVATGLVYAAEDGFRRLPVHWMWWPAIGGLIIGVGGALVPQALGVGYDVIREELTGRVGLDLVWQILLVKTLIWSLSLGSGTSGGVLAPMFLIGGALGSVEAQVLPVVAPGFWPLVALTGVLGGLMRAPLTGVVFAIELTGRLDALLPLVIAGASAYAVSVLVLKRSVLTEKIARRGLHLTREYDVDPLEVLLVHEVMDDEVVTFAADEPLREAAEDFAQRPAHAPVTRQRIYPVLGRDGRLAGVVTRRDLLAAARGGAAGETVADIAVADPVTVAVDDTLRRVAYAMAEHGITRAPVVSREDPRELLGVVTLPQLLDARLRDLREERHAERVLRFRPLIPLAGGRLAEGEEKRTPTPAAAEADRTGHAP